MLLPIDLPTDSNNVAHTTIGRKIGVVMLTGKLDLNVSH